MIQKNGDARPRVGDFLGYLVWILVVLLGPVIYVAIVYTWTHPKTVWTVVAFYALFVLYALWNVFFFGPWPFRRKERKNRRPQGRGE